VIVAYDLARADVGVRQKYDVRLLIFRERLHSYSELLFSLFFFILICWSAAKLHGIMPCFGLTFHFYLMFVTCY
jgi:hypothetical protein